MGMAMRVSSVEAPLIVLLTLLLLGQTGVQSFSTLTSKSRRSMSELRADSASWEPAPKRKPQRKRARNREPPWLSQVPSYTETMSYHQFPCILILVGLPGSGKSTFANKLQEVQPFRFTRINQDELGDRHRCLNAATLALEQGMSPIIDRCNQDKTQRQHWIDLATQFECGVSCIYFDVPKHVCMQRCRRRKNHPTLEAHMVPSVLKRMESELTVPAKSEGFESITVVGDNNSCRDAFLAIL